MRLPTGTAERPLRVVVAGSSTTFMMVPARTSRDVGTWPEWLPELLAARGVVTRATLAAQWHGTVRELGPRYEAQVRDAFPDVLVLAYGIVDAQPRVVPTWLFRNLTTWRPGSSRAARTYRSRVVPRVRPWVMAWQRAASARAPHSLSRTPLRQFEAETWRLVRQAGLSSRPLVLVLGIDPVNDTYEAEVPGLRARVAAFNAALARVVERAADPHVVLVPGERSLGGEDAGTALPDGLHRTADAHRRLAETLTAEILEHREHLDLQPQDRTGDAA